MNHASTTKPSGSRRSRRPFHESTSKVQTVARYPFPEPRFSWSCSVRRLSIWRTNASRPGSMTRSPVSSKTSRVRPSVTSSPTSTRPAGTVQKSSSPEAALPNHHDLVIAANDRGDDVLRRARIAHRQTDRKARLRDPSTSATLGRDEVADRCCRRAGRRMRRRLRLVRSISELRGSATSTRSTGWESGSKAWILRTSASADLPPCSRPERVR